MIIDFPVENILSKLISCFFKSKEEDKQYLVGKYLSYPIGKATIKFLKPPPGSSPSLSEITF